MRYLITLILCFTAHAGLKETQAWHEKEKAALQSKYLAKLKLDLRNATRKGDADEVVAIKAEIKRLTTVLKPMAGAYRIEYTTGVRHYVFDKDGLTWREGRGRSTYTHNGVTVVINHPTGAVETWSPVHVGYRVLFVTPEGRRITGTAKLKR